MKNIVIILLVSLAFISQSCKKDKAPVEPMLELKYDEAYSIMTIQEIDWLSYELMSPIGDTLWPLDSNGLPIKQRNPITGEWNFIYVKVSEVTVAQQLTKVEFKATESLVLQRSTTTIFFQDNPGIKIYLSFPDDTKLINRVTADGKKFADEISALNNVRELLVKNPTKTLTEIIIEIYASAQPTWVAACKEYFIEKTLHPQDPQKKSCAAYESKLIIVADEIASIMEKEEKAATEKLIELAKKLK